MYIIDYSHFSFNDSYVYINNYIAVVGSILLYIIRIMSLYPTHSYTFYYFNIIELK